MHLDNAAVFDDDGKEWLIELVDDDPLRGNDGAGCENSLWREDSHVFIEILLELLLSQCGWCICEEESDIDGEFGATFDELLEICLIETEPLVRIGCSEIALSWLDITEQSLVDGFDGFEPLVVLHETLSAMEMVEGGEFREGTHQGFLESGTLIFDDVLELFGTLCLEEGLETTDFE